MIVVKDLTKTFGHVTAVDSVDFEIPRGEVVGFLGPNGAGKTTTIRMMTGFLLSTQGTIHVDGLSVDTDSLAVRQRIGYLPESSPLYGEMRVGEYLHFRARLFDIRRAERRTAVDRVLQRCGLADSRRRIISQLSKGYRQRVGLAAALVHDPQVLILDEPMSGLDPAQIRGARTLIRELAGEHTILYSSHILHEVELTCDRILMIARGRIRAQGRLEDLRKRGVKINRYVIEARAAGTTEALQRVPAVMLVDRLELAEGWLRLTVTAKSQAGDLREQLSARLAELGASVRELRREAPSLEHLFLQMVTEAEAVDNSPAIKSAPAEAVSA
jgi:ABC-2 type transport system ATP-binding protein